MKVDHRIFQFLSKSIRVDVFGLSLSQIDRQVEENIFLNKLETFDSVNHSICLIFTIWAPPYSPKFWGLGSLWFAARFSLGPHFATLHSVSLSPKTWGSGLLPSAGARCSPFVLLQNWKYCLNDIEFNFVQH